MAEINIMQTPEEKVKQAYLSILGREPTAQELTTESKLLVGEYKGSIQPLTNWLNKTKQYTDQVKQTYQSILGREATQQEIDREVKALLIDPSYKGSIQPLTNWLNQEKQIQGIVSKTMLTDNLSKEEKQVGHEFFSGSWAKQNPGADPSAAFQKWLTQTSDYTNLVPYRKLINEWYSGKPNTPGAFNYTQDQEAADKTAVGQEFRPYYQEQIDQSNKGFDRALQNARQGFSRRGLWGAVESGAAGPVSGMRQVGEQRIGTQRGEANTAYERAYTTAVAQGVQGRRSQSEDVYQKTIYDPYLQQYQEWEKRLPVLQSQQKGY